MYRDKEFINKVIELYPELRSSRKIAKIMKTNQKEILNILHDNGVELIGMIPTAKEEELICNLYVNGNSEEKIHEITGRSRKTIRKILNKYNIERRVQADWLTKYDLNEDYFEVLDSQNKAYILGYFYADGNVGEDNNLVQIGLQDRDLYILEKMKIELGCINRPLYFDNRSNNNENYRDIYILAIKNKKLHSDLINLGVVPRKTHILEFPNFVPEELISHFIRGYFDGDGCVHGTELSDGTQLHSIDICGTELFCNKLKDVLKEKLDINSSIFQANATPESQTKKVEISGRLQCLKFLDWIYKDAEMFLYRKYEIYLSKYKYYK